MGDELGGGRYCSMGHSTQTFEHKQNLRFLSSAKNGMEVKYVLQGVEVQRRGWG